jgi:hypothetical protein
LTRTKYVDVMVVETMKRKILFSITSLFLLSTAFLMSPRPSYALDLTDIWQVVTMQKSSIEVFIKAILLASESAVSDTLTGCTISQVTSLKRDKTPDGLPISKCNSQDPLTGYLPGGGFAYLSMGMEAVTNGEDILPINLAFYARDVASNLPFDIVKTPVAYAAGGDTFNSGLEHLSNTAGFFFEKIVLDLWKAMRNIAYSFIVIILVAVGFMVMFRRKLSAQLTVTVANSLPRLVIGLILITFSYPIAALTLPLIMALTKITGGVFGEMVTNTIKEQGLLNLVISAIASVGPALGPGINMFTAAAVVVFMIAVFFAMFSALFTLIQRFIKIIIATIFGPIILAIGILPGQENLTTDWLKGLFINTISVPAIIAIFYIGMAFLVPIKLDDDPNKILGSVFANYVRWALAIVIMLQARKAPGAIATALKAPEMWVPSVGTAKKK